MSNYEQIAKDAEADLNTYQAKTGSGRGETNYGAGVGSYAENKFEGAEVTSGEDLVTNRGYNRRIPESEGGDRDDRGRETRGSQFEGQGGPEDKLAQAYQDRGGDNDQDVVGSRVDKAEGLGKTDDIATRGQEATRANVGRNPPGPGGSKFKGEDYYTPESVEGSISAQGFEAPESVTEASKTSEGY